MHTELAVTEDSFCQVFCAHQVKGDNFSSTRQLVSPLEHAPQERQHQKGLSWEVVQRVASAGLFFVLSHWVNASVILVLFCPGRGAEEAPRPKSGGQQKIKSRQIWSSCAQSDQKVLEAA